MTDKAIIKEMSARQGWLVTKGEEVAHFSGPNDRDRAFEYARDKYDVELPFTLRDLTVLAQEVQSRYRPDAGLIVYAVDQHGGEYRSKPTYPLPPGEYFLAEIVGNYATYRIRAQEPHLESTPHGLLSGEATHLVPFQTEDYRRTQALGKGDFTKEQWVRIVEDIQSYEAYHANIRQNARAKNMSVVEYLNQHQGGKPPFTL